MRDWQNDAPREIAGIHAAMPGCTPDELRKALRRNAYNFHGGTSWGAKVWSKHCRRYLDKVAGREPSAAPGKPIEWPADICFPFRDSDAMLGTKPEGLSPEGVAARAATAASPNPSHPETPRVK